MSEDLSARGRIWNHRNGQLESDIFDRDLKIKALEKKLSAADALAKALKEQHPSGLLLVVQEALAAYEELM